LLDALFKNLFIAFHQKIKFFGRKQAAESFLGYLIENGRVGSAVRVEIAPASENLKDLLKGSSKATFPIPPVRSSVPSISKSKRVFMV